MKKISYFNTVLLLIVLVFGLSACSTISNSSMSNSSSTFTDPVTGERETNIWYTMHRSFSLDDYSYKREVQSQINWYMSHEDYLIRAATRGSPFIYYIIEEAKKRDLPTELALLPLVESAYNPYANSRAGASGLWQFLRGTATTYSVKRNWWYDGRRDVLASTQAALDYLAYLNQYFNGDWLLAISAYNAGEGRIQSAVDRNAQMGLPTDFWHLQLVPETRDYLPKLLALATILRSPREYPIAWPNTPDKPYLALVNVSSQIDLTRVAEAAGITMTEFYQLNPGFNRSATDPNGFYKIVIPIEHEEQFNAKLSDALSKTTIHWEKYTVKRNDNLHKIADHFQTTLNALREKNQLSTDKLYNGQILLVPVGKTLVPAKETARNYLMAPGSEEFSSGSTTTHRVKAGETLSYIAKKYHVTTKQLMTWNHLKSSSIKPGQKLVVKK